MAELQRPGSADDGLKAHHSAVKALACLAGRNSPAQNALWIHHASVWALPGVARAEGLFQFSFEGTLSVPMTADQTTQCSQALDLALQTVEAAPPIS